MKTKIAYTDLKNIKEAVNELKNQIAEEKIKVLIYFASSGYEAGILAEEMNNAFNGIKVFGCTTSGEIISGKMLKGSIVAMALTEDMIDEFEVLSIKNLKSGLDLDPVKKKIETSFSRKLSELEQDKYFGIVLIDGLSGKEEILMDKLGDLTDIIFVGGSAGDDLKFKSTTLFNGNDAFSDGAVIALFKSKLKFGFIKTQSFKILDKILIPTKVDEENREVIEFNNQPAAEYYAELIGASVENLKDHFMDHPVGLVIDGDPYVRSPQMVKGNTVKFYCNVKEGVQLNLLESLDIINDTKLAIEEFAKENGPISALINFNCILRTLELESTGKSGDYGKLFSEIPTVGFSTYGEEYIGHINQTATILALM
jgi:hypothetical protein